MTDFIVTPEIVELLISPVSPEARINEVLLKAVSGTQIDDCEFLWFIHPEIYREPRFLAEYSQNDADRYRGFLKSIDAALCEIRILLQNLLTWIDPYEAPYPVLKWLSPIVGIDFNFDMPEEMARREIANAIFLWERKGTRDNIGDWVGFITGFRTSIREFYKEVLRTNVWAQAYAEDPSTIVNRGGENYATLPHLDEHHATNTWAGDAALLPFFNFSVAPDTNYGVHGFTQLDDTTRGGEILPGYLFRNHIAIYLDVPDENLELTWFGQPYYVVIINKLERILDLICFYGVVKHLFWAIISDEDAGYCLQDSTEGENPGQTVNCNNVGEECVLCLGETGCIDIEDLLCGTGRLANILMCTNDPMRVTNADGGSPYGGPWLTFFNMRYWTIQSEDTLETWIPDTGGVLFSSVDVLEEIVGEQFIDPYIGQFDSVFGPGQGREFECGISDWVTETCETGAFEDLIIFEDWENPFEDILVFFDDWEFAETFQDNLVFFDDWEFTEVFQDNLVLFEDWEDTTVFEDNLVFFDDWEDNPPAAVPGLTMWLDGGFGTVASSPLSDWIDRSFSGNDATQSVPSARPEFISSESAFNNLPVINFDSSSGQHLIVANDASLNTDRFTCFVVGRWNTPIDFATFISKVVDENFTAGWAIGQVPDSIGNDLRFFVDDVATKFVESTLANGQVVIICVRYDQTNLRLEINGVLIGTFAYGAGVTTSAGPLVIGAFRRPGFPNDVDGELDGDIAEIIYYNTDISDPDKSDVTQYLATKYDLTVPLVPQLEHTETWEPSSFSTVFEHSEDWEPIVLPSAIAGLQFWVQADSGTIGSPVVTTWLDSSVNGYHLTPFGTGGPLLVPGEINGLPIIRFTVNRMLRTGAATPMHGAAGAFISFVHKTTFAPTGSDYIISIPNTTGANGIDLRQVVSGVVPDVVTTSGLVLGSPTTAAFIDGIPRIISLHWDMSTGDVTMYVGSSSVGVTNGASGTLLAPVGQIVVGTFSSTLGAFWAGDIGEIVVYNAALGASDRSSVWTYLSTKWGISL